MATVWQLEKNHTLQVKDETQEAPVVPPPSGEITLPAEMQKLLHCISDVLENPSNLTEAQTNALKYMPQIIPLIFQGKTASEIGNSFPSKRTYQTVRNYLITLGEIQQLSSHQLAIENLDIKLKDNGFARRNKVNEMNQKEARFPMGSPFIVEENGRVYLKQKQIRSFFEIYNDPAYEKINDVISGFNHLDGNHPLRELLFPKGTQEPLTSKLIQPSVIGLLEFLWGKQRIDNPYNALSEEDQSWLRQSIAVKRTIRNAPPPYSSELKKFIESLVAHAEIENSSNGSLSLVLKKDTQSEIPSNCLTARGKIQWQPLVGFVATNCGMQLKNGKALMRMVQYVLENSLLSAEA